jgi:hypothetical protein
MGPPSCTRRQERPCRTGTDSNVLYGPLPWVHSPNCYRYCWVMDNIEDRTNQLMLVEWFANCYTSWIRRLGLDIMERHISSFLRA